MPRFGPRLQETPEEFWAEINRWKQRGWMSYNDWMSQFGRNVAPYARRREYENFLATNVRPPPTPERLRMGVTPKRIRSRPTPERLPTEPSTPPPGGVSYGNTGAPISITYKFSDPAQQAKAEQIKLSPPQTTAKAPSTTNRPLINPLPSQAPTPVGVGGARHDRDWRRSFQSGTRPQNQGFTNWLTRPASPPRTGWGGGYNAF